MQVVKAQIWQEAELIQKKNKNVPSQAILTKQERQRQDISGLLKLVVHTADKSMLLLQIYPF